MKYENGYIPKIQYWSQKYIEATTSEEKQRCWSKLEYFFGRESNRRNQQSSVDVINKTFNDLNGYFK